MNSSDIEQIVAEANARKDRFQKAWKARLYPAVLSLNGSLLGRDEALLMHIAWLAFVEGEKREQ